MAHVEPGSDALPLYVVEPGGAGEQPECPPGAPRHEHPHQPLTGAMQESWAALGRAAHQLSDRLATATAPAPAVAFETSHSLVIAIVRHLVMAPADAVQAFDTLLPRLRDPVVTPRGTLELSTRAPGRGRTDAALLRAVPGRLHLWLSPVPLPVELELVPWGQWRTMITLHPDRRFGWTVGPHRRSRYFAVGHAAMDTVIAELRSLSGTAQQPSYDAPPCGRSSSMPIPAGTA